jgi:nitroreductase
VEDASSSAIAIASNSRSGLLDMLSARRSVAPRKLALPGPNEGELDRMLKAALSGPDHGGLRPWRFIDFPTATRPSLADLFVAEKRRRDPLASELDLQRAREHALVPPALLAFVVSPVPRSPVPIREQWLAAGAALGNFLNAAHLLGYGAMVLSGERCDDVPLQRALGLRLDEQLAGFVSIGTVTRPAREDERPEPRSKRTTWEPVAPRHLLGPS